MRNIHTLRDAILEKKQLVDIAIDYAELDFGHDQLAHMLLGYYTDLFYLGEELTQRDYTYIKSTKELDFSILNNWQKEIDQVGIYTNLLFWEDNHDFWNSNIDTKLLQQAMDIVDTMQDPNYDRTVIHNFIKNYKKLTNYTVTDFVVFIIINNAYLNKNINWVNISKIKSKINL